MPKSRRVGDRPFPRRSERGVLAMVADMQHLPKKPRRACLSSCSNIAEALDDSGEESISMNR